MTGSDRERDVKALGLIIWTTSRADEGTISAAGADIIARAVLASDWLAEHDKAIAAQALREAADDLGPLVDPDPWLLDRADREPCRWANETGDES